MPLPARPVLLFALLAVLPRALTAAAQNSPDETAWSGTWAAEGLPFVVEARASDNRLEVRPVAPANPQWTTWSGRIDRQSATIEAEYQGVTAVVLIELLSDDRAVVQALSCQPDYHFICTLSRNQQALFHRQPPKE